MKVGWMGIVVAGALVGLGASGAPARGSEVWPGLRGPSFDGAVRDGELLSGEAAGLVVAWKRELGSGYSVVAVDGERAVTQFADGETDFLGAFDAATGRELWRHPLGAAYRGHSGSHDGPIASPVVGDGRVFGLGPRGRLVALAASDGRELWSRHLAEDLGGEAPYYGFGASPVLAEGILVVAVGAEEKAVLGLDAETGEPRWSLGEGSVEYNSPILASLGGRRQVVVADGTHLFGVEPATGRELWRHVHGGDRSAKGGATIVPIPAGEDRILLLNTSATSLMLHVTVEDGAFTARELWSGRGIGNTYVQPVYHDGHLYGMAGTIFTCVEAATGKTVWRSREPGDGFPTLVGDQLVVLTKAGALHVVGASPEGYRELAALDLFDGQSWTAAAFAGGHLYARSMGQLAKVSPARAEAGPAAAEGAPGQGERSWVAASPFGEFLAGLAGSEDPAEALEAYLEERAARPLVDPGGVVHFLYRSPAEDVAFVGDVIGSRIEEPMRPIAGTEYFRYSALLEGDAAVAYGFIPAFGEVTADPHNPRRMEGAFGEASWFSMPGWEAPVAARAPEGPEAAEGRLETLEWVSGATDGATRKALVYLPPQYSAEGQAAFPVLYVLDGERALEEGETVAILDRVMGRSVEPLVVVFVQLAGEQPQIELFRPASLLAAVREELLPRVEESYRTRRDPRYRGVMGWADSARIAFRLAFEPPYLFGRLAAVGPDFLDFAELGEIWEESWEGGELPPLAVYHSWGRYHLRAPLEAWDMAQNNRRLWQLLHRRGYRPAGGETSDGYGWFAWRARTDDWLRILFPSSR